MFNSGLSIGQELKNDDIVNIFGCANMGGMRRSLKTNTLVIISDYTNGLYHDKWVGGVLHYTGMGKNGDQDINWAQNKILANYESYNVEVHLFEVMDPGVYTYCGQVELVGKPYIDIQPGDDGRDRKVWMFPIKPVSDMEVMKPRLFVFRDMEDYKARGALADKEYIRQIEQKGKRNLKNIIAAEISIPKVSMDIPKKKMIVPKNIVGKKIKHNKFGEGTIISVDGDYMVAKFLSGEEKKMSYSFCIENKIVEIV